MNSRTESKTPLVVYFVATVGAALILAGLSWLLFQRTRPAGLNQARIAERIKNLSDITGASSQALNHYGWLDQSKGLVRLPITNAMQWVVREWHDPAAARSNLLARVDKANPPPPPPEPPKPTAFE